MQIISGASYRDVNANDFVHYFGNTAMVLKLPTNKKRIFVVTIAESNRIYGKYLTREKMWKEKVLAFHSWADQLDVIPPTALYFNTPQNVGIWAPNLSQNRKKSFPYFTQHVKFQAPPRAEDTTEQEVVHSAFAELYSPHTSLPDGDWALRSSRPATLSQGGFIVNRQMGILGFKNAVIGKVVEGRVEIPINKKFFASYLVEAGGFRPESISIVEQQAPVPQPEEPTTPTTFQDSTPAPNPNSDPVWTPHPPTHFLQNYVLRNSASPPWDRINTPPPILGMTRSNTFYDTCSPSVQHQNRRWHWATPPGSQELGWRADVYDQMRRTLSTTWRQPLWGRGWAQLDGDYIITHRGLVPPSASNVWRMWG